jgi:hypothetical protein
MVVVAAAALILGIVAWERRPRTFPVSGTLTFNGRPLASGKISFVPSSPAGQQASAQIIAGSYALGTFAANDGAIPGSYTVVIVSPGIPAMYQSQSTSVLKAQVQEGSNVIDLDLR